MYHNLVVSIGIPICAEYAFNVTTYRPGLLSLIVHSPCESLNRRPWPGAQIMTRCVSLAAEAKLPLGAELPWK